MTNEIDKDSDKWSGNMFVTKQAWASYVERKRQDNSYDDLGYLDATEGIVSKLEEALQMADPERFRAAIVNLIDNRKELVEHACRLMDNILVKSDYKVNNSMKL